MSRRRIDLIRGLPGVLAVLLAALEGAPLAAAVGARTPSSRMAGRPRRYLPAKLASAASTSSTSSGVCEALTWKRISSSPRGTTG